MTNLRWLGWAAVLMVMPGVTFADAELAAEVAEMAESDLRDACDDEDYLACLKVKSAACKSAVSSAIEACRARLPKDVSEDDLNNDPDAVIAAWSSCVHAKLSTTLKIGTKTIERCNSGDIDDGSEPREAAPAPRK